MIMKIRQLSFALKVPLYFAVIGGIWILLSDKIAAALFTDPAALTVAQTYKGWIFILVISIFLFVLIKRESGPRKTAQQNYSDLFESAVDGIFQSSPEGRFISVNPAMANIFGYSSAKEMLEMVGDISSQIHLNQESRQRFVNLLNQHGVVEKFEAKNLRKDGSIIWTSTNARLIRDTNGNAIYYEGFVTDISGQKRAETTLRETEERYRSLVEELPAVIFLDTFNDPQAGQYISPRIKNLLGYTPEEWMAKDNLWESSLHPNDKERVLAEDIRTNETGDPFRIEYRIRTKDGHYVWIKEDAYLIRGSDGTPKYRQGILLDISEQKKAQEGLQQRESILETVGFAAEQFLKSPNWEACIPQVLERFGKTTQASRVYVFKKQISPEEKVLISQMFEWCDIGIEPQINNQDLQDMDFGAAGYDRWIKLFNDGLPIYGTVKNLPENEQVEFVKEGILSIICFPIDIQNDWWGFIGFDDCREERNWSAVEIEALHAAVGTLGAAIQRKASEELIQKGEISYRGLFNSVHDAIYIQDTEGRFLDVNDGAVKMYGYPKEFFIGKTPEPLSAPGRNDLEKVAKAIQRAFQGEPQYFEFWGIRSNGEVFPKDVRLYKGTYFGQDAVITIAQDITGRKQAEEALQKQLKELTVLHTVALAESSARNMDELIQRVTDIIGDTLYSDNCGVMLLNSSGDALQPHSSYRGTNAENLSTVTPLSWGISGKVVSTGKPIRTGNVSLDSDYYETTQGIQSELCVPIISGNKIFGALNAESKRADAFTDADERLLNTIAGGLATALEKLLLFKAEKKRREDAEALREATSALTTSLELSHLLETILDSLGKLIPYDSASINLKQNEKLEIVAGRGLPEGLNLIGKRYDSAGNWKNQVGDNKPIILADAQADPRFEKWPGTEYIRGWMGIPLFARNQFIGFINLDSRAPNAFSEEDAIIAQTFANQAAITIENARLFQSEQKRRQEAENLRIAATALTSTLEPQQVLETILVALQQVIDYDSASILQLEGDHVRITAGKDLPHPELAINQVFPANNALLCMINQDGQPLIVEDCEVDSRFQKWAAADKVRGWMGVPLTARGQVIGYITLDSFRPNSFNANDAALAQTFAHQATAAIENARLYTETRQRLEELEVVSRVSFALRAAQDSDEMLPILLNEIKTNMDTDTVSIWLYDPEKDELVQKISSGMLSNLPRPNFKPNEGLVGLVFSTGKYHVSDEFAKDNKTHFENVNSFEKDWGGITVPIRATSETIGAMVVAIHAPRRIEAHHTRLMTTIAEIAGNAIYRSNLYGKSEEQIRRLTTLREIDTAIASSFDLRVTLDVVMEHLLSKMEVGAAAILTFNFDSHTLDYFTSMGFHGQEINHKSMQVGEGLAGQIPLDQNDIYIEDLRQKTDFLYSNLIFKEGFVSYYAVPLQSKGSIKGVLETYFRHSFTPGADWIEFLHTLAGQATIAIDNARLFEDLQRSNQELSLAYDTTLEGWGKALELRDKETEGHTRRVTQLTIQLARQLNIPDPELTHLRRGVLLHDIGKMGVPDNILRKEGPLTQKEWIEMRKHPQYAYDLLYPITYLRPALVIPYYHHEWWDGSGYPTGIKGDEIPLPARIFAIVDVWDALLSNRSYRQSWSRQDVLKYIRELSGKQFDPDVATAFLKMMDAIDLEHGKEKKVTRKKTTSKNSSKNKKMR